MARLSRYEVFLLAGLVAVEAAWLLLLWCAARVVLG